MQQQIITGNNMPETDQQSEWKARIKRGMGRDALEALKERFNYYAPAFLYQQDAAGGVEYGHDARMVVLNAAVRDGQREVLMYLEQILHHD